MAKQKITDIRYVCGQIDDDTMAQFGNTLNEEGFELLKLELDWVDKTIGNTPGTQGQPPQILPYKVPSVIALFVKMGKSQNTWDYAIKNAEELLRNIKDGD